MGFKKPSFAKPATVDNFIAKADLHDLTALSLSDLVNQFDQIDQQSQLLKGLILLEARSRFQSDKEFGQWIVTSGLSASTTHQTRTVYMNFARFFKNRDMTGISLTCAYEISRPSNSDIAEDLYVQVVNRNLSVFEIKEKIAELKNQAGIPLISKNEQEQKVSVFVLAEELQTYKDVILDDIKELSSQEAVCVLKACLKEFQEKKETNIQDGEVVT